MRVVLAYIFTRCSAFRCRDGAAGEGRSQTTLTKLELVPKCARSLTLAAAAGGGVTGKAAPKYGLAATVLLCGFTQQVDEEDCRSNSSSVPLGEIGHRTLLLVQYIMSVSVPYRNRQHHLITLSRFLSEDKK